MLAHCATLSIIALLFAGCVSSVASEEEVLILEVAPETVDCIGEMRQRCLRIRRPPAAEWTNFYGSIEGFTHEEGYRYRLEVRRQRIPDPPADGSSFRYRLVRILERERADSG